MNSRQSAWFIARQDVVVYGNDDHPMVWPIVDRTTGEPLPNVAGWSARAQVREMTQSGDGALLHEWKTDDGSAVFVETPEGAPAIALLIDDSDKWSWRKGWYDIALRDNEQCRRMLAHGRITFRPGITR